MSSVTSLARFGCPPASACLNHRSQGRNDVMREAPFKFPVQLAQHFQHCRQEGGEYLAPISLLYIPQALSWVSSIDLLHQPTRNPPKPLRPPQSLHPLTQHHQAILHILPRRNSPFLHPNQPTNPASVLLAPTNPLQPMRRCCSPVQTGYGS